MHEFFIKGTFSLAEIHSWILACIPEVPEKPQYNETNILMFCSSFLETVIHCTFSKGEAIFKSDNISSIAILKDYLSREATRKKIKLDFKIHINEQTTEELLELLIPKLIEIKENINNAQLYKALKEMEIDEVELENTMTTKYADILKNKNLEQARYASEYLLMFIDNICNIYLDYHKFKGTDAQSRLPFLKELLKEPSIELLVEFFKSEF